MPPPGLNLPVSMGPINLPEGIHQPEPKRKRRWGWLLVWTLLVFVGGIAAGPTLTDQAVLLVERVSSMLGMSTPQFVQKLKPAPPSVMPLPAQGTAAAPVPVPPAGAPNAPTGEERGQAPTVAKTPIAAPAERKAEPEKPAVAAPPRNSQPAHGAAATARDRVENAVTEPARPQHAKDAVRTASAKGTPVRKSAKNDDPFANDAETANEPKTATPSHKSKPTFDESAGTAKSEPAPKPAASKSHDPLDNLMADVVTDNKGKNKKRESKDIDTMLKDVQKSNPAPPPKRDPPPSLPPLSPADISRVMAGVKTRGNDCAQRFGQKGVAELKLTVGKDGKVTNVVVGGKLANTPVAACIEKATRAASFPPSSGLRFDYKMDVH